MSDQTHYPELISPQHVAALRALADRLAVTDIVWALTGSMSFALQGVAVPAHDIDVQTDAAGAYRIATLFPNEVLRPVGFSGTERIRSHFGVLTLSGVIVELMGGVQKRLPDRDWEPVVDVRTHRCFVQFADLSIPVLALAYEEHAYRMLGRIERADLLRRHLAHQDGSGTTDDQRATFPSSSDC
ncbi:hypothetical protein [Candidatus Chloroploca sp. Khr17]|uniref:nucleotidyltransferase domain-containing protein n=1 Tax=Candidatus Chloroploca sp. Khr17 TaxID=2496869 RepID=UPI00196AD7C7|nr:hypothetical protein [Candidatus Chloroploca sp. Khr17]